MKLMLTGASGFVGSYLLQALADYSICVLGRVRPTGYEGEFFQSEIGPHQDYTEALRGVDIVIHCAAKNHTMESSGAAGLSVYRDINSLGTLSLANQAASLGVKRFIFISTIKVLGESTSKSRPFNSTDKVNPSDAYSQSKAEAEEHLKKLALNSRMEYVIIRPPLVYGAGVKGNFGQLKRLVARGWVLPVGAIDNKRSMVALDNLVDLIKVCINHVAAANQTFLVSDNYDVSTAELVQEIGRAMHKRAWILPIPERIIRLLARLIGKKAYADRLCGSMRVDISYTVQTLGWHPPLSFQAAVERCI